MTTAVTRTPREARCERSGRLDRWPAQRAAAGPLSLAELLATSPTFPTATPFTRSIARSMAA
jgi:hypothetical protein